MTGRVFTPQTAVIGSMTVRMEVMNKTAVSDIKADCPQRVSDAKITWLRYQHEMFVLSKIHFYKLLIYKFIYNFVIYYL